MDEEAVFQYGISVQRHGADETAASVGLVPGVRVADESVEHTARNVALLVSRTQETHESAIKGSTTDGAADKGAHAAVLNGEITVGRAYQTAYVVPITALNLSRCM